MVCTGPWRAHSCLPQKCDLKCFGSSSAVQLPHWVWLGTKKQLERVWTSQGCLTLQFTLLLQTLGSPNRMVFLPSALLNNLVIHLHLLPNKYVSTSRLPLYKDLRLQVSPLNTTTAPLAKPPRIQGLLSCLVFSLSTLLPPTSLSLQVLFSFSYGQIIFMEIARHALFVLSNPCWVASSIHINSCMGSLSSSMGLIRTFRGWVLQKSSFCTCQRFVPFKPIPWHHGMEGVITIIQPQSNYWEGLAVPFLQFLHLLSVPLFLGSVWCSKLFNTSCSSASLEIIAKGLERHVRASSL